MNVDLNNFSYTASHDLKAPISNIEGLLLALLDELPPGTAQSPAIQPLPGLMQKSVNRFKQTIDHLTDVSKLQKEHGQPTEPVDLAAVVRDVCLDLDHADSEHRRPAGRDRGRGRGRRAHGAFFRKEPA